MKTVSLEVTISVKQKSNSNPGLVFPRQFCAYQGCTARKDIGGKGINDTQNSAYISFHPFRISTVRDRAQSIFRCFSMRESQLGAHLVLLHALSNSSFLFSF